MLLGDDTFCHVWGTLWEVLPSHSVFSVMVLLWSRMLTMCRPLKQLDTRKFFIFSVGYSGFILARIIVLLCFFREEMDIIFSSSVNYCYLAASQTDPLFNALQFFTALQLALPVLPVLLCFLISLHKLRKCRKKARIFGRSGRFIRAANTTLLVVTLYIIFNIPVFVNYCYYGYWLLRACYSQLSRDQWIDYSDYYNNEFLFNYSWVITYVVCVAVNSTLNPFVYYRMLLFKTQVKHAVVGLCSTTT